MAAANKVSKLIVGQGGFLSTPAVSNIIRKLSHHMDIITIKISCAKEEGGWGGGLAEASLKIGQKIKLMQVLKYEKGEIKLIKG
jgi:hypothetical protein